MAIIEREIKESLVVSLINETDAPAHIIIISSMFVIIEKFTSCVPS